LASATIDGDIVTIRNVRNFDWRSETNYTPRWETRRYDLSQLRGADMFLSYWGPRAIAHTIMSWEFADGHHLAISIETRKKKGQDYSALLGFFRQYEIYYVVADERDLIGVRAMYRGEDLYLYRLKNPPAQARAILLDYLKEINRLDLQPEWYNALVHNCTTTIRHHALDAGAGRPFDWRILANGYIDELGYERGQIDTSLPFAELRRRSDITAKAKAAYAAGGDFSRRIRAGLPGERRPLR
jgi:glycosidase